MYFHDCDMTKLSACYGCVVSDISILVHKDLTIHIPSIIQSIGSEQ